MLVDETVCNDWQASLVVISQNVSSDTSLTCVLGVVDGLTVWNQGVACSPVTGEEVVSLASVASDD